MNDPDLLYVVGGDLTLAAAALSTMHGQIVAIDDEIRKIRALERDSAAGTDFTTAVTQWNSAAGELEALYQQFSGTTTAGDDRYTAADGAARAAVPH
ncbi:hypothetical protein [Actinocatenispora rupis]|uniref:Uncharacterized protein n=1 Tax=Actinocatenispora rupis TaxID=519421 RepID=A0A8J3JF15_9ACTN|nr:hypothetical protein [Actinocatenispora rupis]GID14743.1 hypothetical protein Aru02nite_56320 [Actinocatenispora rupis]